MAKEREGPDTEALENDLVEMLVMLTKKHKVGLDVMAMFCASMAFKFMALGLTFDRKDED